MDKTAIQRAVACIEAVQVSLGLADYNLCQVQDAIPADDPRPVLHTVAGATCVYRAMIADLRKWLDHEKQYLAVEAERDA